ncbi:MAG TPA: cbb3-type cytochrome c oxidase N-terminal domain-containing protein [Anaeromyxobacteraceae bacterium]|nr:cbb3-type cytochrome c oxidase N-terminal domain-containing protein [Anaeromyxobacteraceae bacterium]
MTTELPDSAEALEAKDTAKKLPWGWRLLFIGLIAWGAFYLWRYSPWSTGWTQAGEYETAQAPAAATNLTHTILYTAIPALVLLFLAVAMARRRPQR